MITDETVRPTPQAGAAKAAFLTGRGGFDGLDASRRETRRKVIAASGYHEGRRQARSAV
jgi:hypothetical protein